MAEGKPAFVLYAKENCHLFEIAKDMLQPICEQFEIPLQVEDITHNSVKLAQFGGEVPVGFLNGEKVFKYHVEPRRLKRLLKKARRML